MNARRRLKLDPALRRLVREPRAKGKRVQVFIEVAHAKAARWLKRQRGVTDLVQVVDGYYTATVQAQRVETLAAGKGVLELEKVRYFRPQLHRSLASIHGREPPSSGGPIPDGEGAVIGIVDYGLDFKLQDFKNAAGETRIAYLWDHDLEPRRGERSPPKYGYGVEYSSADIRRGKIRHKPLNNDPRVSGHGTHVAGIAAGNGETVDRGKKPGTHVGVAPKATLVFVNLKRRDVLEQVGAASGTIANSVKLAHAIAYCFERADKLKLPCVVNLSLGFNGGGHDGNMVVEWAIDALLRKRGRAVVIAAGNEDQASAHAAGSLKRGRSATLDWEIIGKSRKIGDLTANELEIWYPRGSALDVCVVAPDKEASRSVAPGKGDTYPFAHGEKVIIESDAATPWGGAARIHIELTPGKRERGIRAETWIVKLTARRVARQARGRVRFDAWIERPLAVHEKVQQRSRFAARHDKPKTAITLTTPATARRAITVASYRNDGSADPDISGFSGRGPARDGRKKPDLAAPGEPVWSTNVHAGRRENGNLSGKRRRARVAMGGTSMSAPHVAGVVARLLSRNASLTAARIRDLLIRTASRKRWDPKWGYGRVDAARALERLERRRR